MIRLAEYRKMANLTQEDLAYKTGFSVDSIQRWEKGYRSPKVSQLEKLAEALGCQEGDLLEKKGNPTQAPVKAGAESAAAEPVVAEG